MSIGKALKGLVGMVAPTIGTALGGPLGGVAMKFLADKFTDGDTGEVEDYLLSANPEQLANLKQANLEFEKHMADLGVRLEELEVQDRQGARDLAKEKGIKVQAGLSGLYTVGYFATLSAFILGWASVSAEMHGMVQTLIGALGAAQLQILNFWFGSSRGSKDKTDAMTKMANGK
jgi:hypothetical protein